MHGIMGVAWKKGAAYTHIPIPTLAPIPILILPHTPTLQNLCQAGGGGVQERSDQN